LLLQRGRAFTAQVSLPRVAISAAVLIVMVAAASRTPSWIAFAQSATPSATAVVPANSHSFLAGLVAAGYGDLPVDDIVNLKMHGLSAHNLREARTYGPNLSLRQIVKLKQAGVI